MWTILKHKYFETLILIDVHYSYLLPSLFSMSMIDSFNCCLDSSVLQFVVRLPMALVIVLSISEVSSLDGDEVEAGAGVLRVETESAAMVAM